MHTYRIYTNIICIYIYLDISECIACCGIHAGLGAGQNVKAHEMKTVIKVR